MDLLERFAAGDMDAFEELFRQHQKAVNAWTVRIVRDPGIAEDLTVERSGASIAPAPASAWEAISAPGPGASPPTQLSIICPQGNAGLRSSFQKISRVQRT